MPLHIYTFNLFLLTVLTFYFCFEKMDHHFDLHTLKNTYSSLLEHICSNTDLLKLSNSVSNIWKTTDRNFLLLVTSFFSKQSNEVKHLIPSSKLYSKIILFCEKNNDQELLKWVKSFNNIFISSVTKTIKRNKIENYSSNEILQFSLNNFKKLKLKNQRLEKNIEELKHQLELYQDKCTLLSTTIENFADEECEHFRKRMRTKISSINDS